MIFTCIQPPLWYCNWLAFSWTISNQLIKHIGSPFYGFPHHFSHRSCNCKSTKNKICPVTWICTSSHTLPWQQVWQAPKISLLHIQSHDAPSQSRNTSMIVKKNIADNFLTSIHDLNIRLKQFQNKKLAEQIMWFDWSLRGTRYFLHKAKKDLIDIISHVSFLTLFFTLSVTDTKWPNLHPVMLGCQPHDVSKWQKWRNDNIISNPHLTSLYIHHIFTIFCEVILEKCLQKNDYWYRYALHQNDLVIL